LGRAVDAGIRQIENLAGTALLFDLTPNVVKVLASLFGALLFATLLRAALAIRRDWDEPSRQRLRSLATWCVLAIFFSLALVFGRFGAAVFFGAASLQGMREFLSLLARAKARRRRWAWIYAFVPLQYLWVCLEWWQWFVAFLPVTALIVLAASTVLAGSAKGFLRGAAALQWGVMVVVYLPSHAAWVSTLPSVSNAAGGAAGWLLYLVLLTEINDIAQALWGRWLGHRRIVPIISPHKTWEGFIGGLLTTVVLAVVLAPWLTGFSAGERAAGGALAAHTRAAVAGMLIAAAGFLGDINMSAVKRDRGVKDSGNLLPGQGGMLDRIDSLTFTAPCFLYYLKLVIGP
jgi:phosphatidate cytidylyltransferase